MATYERWRHEAHGPALQALNLDPVVTEFLGGELPTEQVDEVSRTIEAHWETYGFGLWAVIFSGECAGFVGAAHPGPHWPADVQVATEVGWRLARAAWGHGLATQGARRDGGARRGAPHHFAHRTGQRALDRRRGAAWPAARRHDTPYDKIHARDDLRAAVKRFNWHTAELSSDAGDPDAFRVQYASVGKAIGAEHLGGQMLEVAPGQRSFPYHWEAGQEEWLIVLSGDPTLRTPEGTQPLRAGDVVCFPVGPAGAHQVINETDAPARLLFFSDRRDPNVIMYPDSGKVGVRAADIHGNFAANASLDYWENES